MKNRGFSWIRSTYFFQYAGFGVFVVYLSLYYKRLGLSNDQIGVLAAVYPLVGLALNPVWGLVSDQALDPRRMIRWLLIVSVGVFLLIPLLKSFALLFCVIVIFAIFYSPITSLMDALVLGVVARWGGDYGRLRLWGSIGYTFPALLMWVIFHFRDDMRVIFPLFAILTVIAIILFYFFPAEQRTRTPRLDLSAFRLLRQPMVIFFFLGGFLQKVSMSGYYGFFSIYLDDLQVGTRYIGFVWALGPIAETLSLFFAWRCVERWGVRRILTWSLAATALRLYILSLAPPVGIILGTQLLHAFTYGTMHAGCLYYLARKAGDQNRASVQGLYNAICIQMSMVLGQALAGFVAEQYSIATLFRVYGLLALVTTIIFGLFFRDDTQKTVATD